MNLSQTRYWNLLLHMNNGKSEIDDPRFFFAKDGKTNAKAELNATIDALFNETTYDDNSTACRFPARKAWLEQELQITNFPNVECKEYNKILDRLDPKSATLVFPSAHINSPASMFGHTFLRINSGYDSKLLSYAINYAADANPDKENGVIFAIKGLIGGYYGMYSLLPYYEKLKEYRDTEKRDIWEYDLDLNQEEVLKMVRHIWELNGTHSYYYFFTENCSYNMLWLIEIARPSIHLREYFNYQVIPLETVHAAKLENILKANNYRASKRTILLEYETLINEEYMQIPSKLINSKISIQSVVDSPSIDSQQKMYILEAAVEFLEYSFAKNEMNKDEFLELFHNLSKARASLGEGKRLDIATPPNPIESHRGVRATAGFGFRENEAIGFLGIRPAYHNLKDSNYGFLRGTQIEFMNFELSYTDDEIKVEDATILSIASIAQRSEFFDNISWRTKFGWDRNYLDNGTNFIGTVGIGLSWGNKLGYIYAMADPLFYLDGNIRSAIGTSIGIVFDKYNHMSTNFEATRRWYDTGDQQWLIELTQSLRISQNTQLQFNYTYKDRYKINNLNKEQTYKLNFNYYF
ncbi:MAG: DUF4105 domain-containing protein [Sulfurimonas sp.]|uniref:Lnb N-terminal periplasmic domain-containing protein n=1 Tax=Sulfurimonas sp. TaxID=2022749 RepID=UPI002611B4BD|nr:DUF4105 domain-containing protein [Sulfurimonas sp.]MCW8895412.1 DUF4105 domain-containing protein [Sulfurimonas sp.]MCW8953869.1 DUF4105 domain-containing protein [Sulfurimonas sp.]MCW9067967.1 DUF4105 domain-containing protein [Sulfurimonas sp.]